MKWVKLSLIPNGIVFTIVFLNFIEGYDESNQFLIIVSSIGLGFGVIFLIIFIIIMIKKTIVKD